MKRCIQLVSLLCTALLMITGVSCSRSQQNQSIKMIMNQVPSTLDPQMVNTEEQLLLVRNCFEGLFRAVNGSIEPAACESYTVSDDKKVYRFTLKSGLTWSDGSALTADHFAFGLMRCLDAQTQAPNVEGLFSIQNAQAYYKGKAARNKVGISADGNTLTIRLSVPDDELLQKLTYAYAMPCKKGFFEQAKGRYCMTDDLFLCNGPFTLASWDTDGNSVQIERNSHYSGSFEAKPSYITISYSNDGTDRLKNISDGVYDMGYLSYQKNSSADNTGLTVLRSVDTAWFIAFNPKTDTAISDAAVSAALKKALEPSLYQSALPNGFTAQRSAVPADLLVNGKRYSASTKSAADLARAKQDFIQALKKYNGQFPGCTLLYPEGEGMKELVSSIVSVWQVELGAYINIKALSQSELDEACATGQYQVILYPVSCHASNSAWDYIRRFSSKPANRFGITVSGVNDALAQQAKGKGNIFSLQSADTALQNHKQLIPIAQSTVCYVASKKLEGLTIDSFPGRIDLFSIG